MYRYETHLHTSPVSRCAKAGVREVLLFYAERGYDGVFITNHFLDGNIGGDRSRPYAEQIEFYFSDYEEALRLSGEIGIKVFLGVEMSYGGTDFLVYGLDKAWFLSHPEIMQMKMREKLAYLAEGGAYIVQAHPFREARYIDHIRLFPRSVHAVEILNAHNKAELANRMAELYAENYGLCKVAGSDNHFEEGQNQFAGVQTEYPLSCERDYIEAVERGDIKIFHIKPEGEN